MKIKAKDIELFKNLSQFDLEDVYYDFHNEFNCTKIYFSDRILFFLFEKISCRFVVKLSFFNVALERFDFCNFSQMNNLTIDSLYRGRYEKENKLFEFSNSGSSFFYLEFYEGGKIEFWCDEILVENE